MEAAIGAPAAAEGQPTEGQVQGEEAQGQEDGGVDLGQWQQSIDTQLGQAADSIRQLAEQNQTLLQRIPEPEAGPGFEEQFSELFEQGGGYVDPQQLQGLVQQQIQQGIQEAMAPLQEQFGEIQQQMTSQELAQLQTRFPELADQKAADALADQVVSTAVGILPKGAPPQVAEALMQNADFVALVHLAEKAKGAGQQETPAGQGQTIPQIETGGGAAPGSTAEGDEWDQIANAGRPGGGRIW